MARVSKKRKEILSKFDPQTQYSLADAHTPTNKNSHKNTPQRQ